MQMRLRVVVALFAIILCLPVGAQAASDPRQVIQVFCDRLIDVMKTGQKLGFHGRAEKLRPAVAAAYDMAAMTRGTLGPASARLTPEEASRLAETFSRFSVSTYADQFNDWDGERFDVGEARPSTEGQVIVPSRIVPKSGDPVEIDYLMHEVGGQWKIVDVLFEGAISQVAVRRSEFVPIFRKKGVDGLIQMLDAQAKTMETR